jgi:glycosyltransferase involved in cell wall biosynthesis
MLNILILTGSYPSSHEPVSRTFMTDFVSFLARQVRIVILAPHKPGIPYRETDGNITIIRYPYWFTASGECLGKEGGLMPSLTGSILAPFQLIPFFICQFLVALQIIRGSRIDLIHSHWVVPQGLTGSVLHLVTGIPHVTSIHGTDIHLIHSHRSAHPVMRFIGKYSSLITTNSSHTNRLLREIMAPPAGSRIVPMGINPDDFAGSRSAGSPETKMVLFVGRLIELKGVNYLIRALRIIRPDYPRLQLVVIGDGPARSQLEEEVVNSNLESVVTFTGSLGRDLICRYYNQADIFVLPSITLHEQSEGLGVVLLEAMASGVPVIGTNTGGIPDIIEDNVNGFLVPPGDPGAIARAILSILEDADLAERFRKAGLKTVQENFSWERITEVFMEIYRTAMESPDVTGA